MSKWRDTGDWSYWVCAHKGCLSECFDPDTVSVTSCGNGHTNYLGPPTQKQWRRAYVSARERAKDLRETRALCEMMHAALNAGRKAIVKSGRKPRL